MMKRALCFLTAAVLLLLPWIAPAEEDDECLHTPASQYVKRGAVPADVGQPGYSGDWYCPLCGAKMAAGYEIPALEPPVGAAMDGQQDQENGENETPVTVPESNPSVQGDTPAQPEEPLQDPPPAQPEAPVTEEKPAQPEEPLQDLPPAQPEAPVTEEKPAAQEEPAVKPEKPAGPSVSGPKEEAPAEPEQPVVLPSSGSGTKEGGNGQAVTEPKKQTAPKKTGSGDKQPQAREHFSSNYPYRRIRITPDPAAQAEAAGTRTWPVASSPFQKLLQE